MHRPPSPGWINSRSAAGTVAALVLAAGIPLLAQVPGKNVNMVAGSEWPGGDPFLQRQNEPSIAASTRNPLHLVGGSNDYRTVDLPGLAEGVETGDAWLGVYKSFDGGQRWSSTLIPGFPQDTSPAGQASPLKGYQAAADPVVRAGTSGLIYYNGLVFDRGENGKSGIFVARFIDRNNKENGDPVAYLGTSMVMNSKGDVFLDKPWMAVDIPRGNNPGQCVVGGTPNGRLERVPAGAVYVAYTAITGDGPTLRSAIFIQRSMDCGATWSRPILVSRLVDHINQGATIAIAPQSGDVFVAWRRFASPNAPDADAIMVSRFRINAASADPPVRARWFRRIGSVTEALDRIFEHRRRRSRPSPAASVSELDQGTSPLSFRTNAYPTMTVDGAGRVYVAWAERGFATLRPDPVDGDARILVTTTTNGQTFSPPTVVDQAQAGHQFMPSLTFAGGKLMLVYYDLRETAAQLFSRFINDADSTNGKRHTIDIRAALGTPGASPSFAPSVPVSDYLTGFRSGTSAIEKLQVNPPNLPMFKLGTVPFIGDYIDVAPAPAFVPLANGRWAYNTTATLEFPIFHAAWTDNRDVRPPQDGNWSNYAPPTIDGQPPGTSLFDPTKTVPVCLAGNAGSRNQNVYTARIAGGLLVGAPGNTKPLSTTIQRAFVVFAQNQTTVTKTFRMTVLGQPPGGRASFDQFPRPPFTPSSPAPRLFVDVRVPARSTASRSLYITSSNPKAAVAVDVSEVTAVGGPEVVGGLEGKVLLNPDITNPDIENPDIENPDIENPDIENAEVYNPDIENPDIENPDIENPDIENPDIENPDIENVIVANPDIENIGVGNPDIENPDIENPDIENPDIENPDIENGTISDVTWTVSNTGNTTSAFNVNLFLANTGVPTGLNTQLIIYKTYKTPVVAPNGCDLRVETRNVLLYNVPNPNFVTPGEGLPDQNDPSDTNATLSLAPGEVGRITLRIYDNDASNNIIVTNPDGSTASVDPAFNPATTVTAAVAGQGVDILDPPGATEPPVVTPTGTNLFFLQQPTNVAPGVVIAPPVRVRVWSNNGAPLPGVNIAIALDTPPPGVVLSGTTSATTDVNGIATFATLSVNQAATGLRLRAQGTSPGVSVSGTSAPFTVGSATLAFVSISDYASIFDGTPKPVTVNTDPSGLAVNVTYDGAATVPSAIGAYLVSATVTTPGFTGGASAVKTIASTLSGGGSGGAPYGPRSCGPGVFANGVRPSTNSYYGLLSNQLLCGDGNHPPRDAGPLPPGQGSYTETDLTCAPGEVVVGVFGQSGAPFGFRVVENLGLRCQSPGGGPITDVGPAGGGLYPDQAFSLACNPGQAVTGVVGGRGEVVDAIALVCTPVAPTIASTSPATIAPEQMIVLRGANMPATSELGILFNQGGPDLPASYTFTAGPTLVIARSPVLLVPGPATVRSADGIATTPAFPITITAIPGAPVLTALRGVAGCGGADISSVTAAQQVFVLADGVDTFGTTFIWTPSEGPALESALQSTTAGPGGAMCQTTTTPALTSGAWTLQVRTTVGASTSPSSNGIAIAVPFP